MLIETRKRLQDPSGNDQEIGYENLEQLQDLIYCLIHENNELIAINQELWRRCLPNKAANHGSDLQMMFKRPRFDTIEVTTVSTTLKSHLKFVVNPEQMVKKFSLPPSIPGEMNYIVPIPPKASPEEVFCDYSLYVKRSMCLHDEVLFYFLVLMNDHLKEVRNYLSDIDTWIIEPNKWLTFINRTFREPMVMPELPLEFAHETVLMVCPLTEVGLIEKSFPIETESQQKTLIDFIEFVCTHWADGDEKKD